MSRAPPCAVGIVREGGSMDPAQGALLTDLYQLTMMQAYLDGGETKTASFEFFVRKLPRQRGFLIAAGLEQVLEFLSHLRFAPEELDWLARTGRFGKDLIDYLAGLRFTGDIHAIPEGTVFFADEPILRVTAPLPEAQLVETRLINLLPFQSMIAPHAPPQGAGGAGQGSRRFWAAPGARRRGWPARRARELHRGLCRHRHGARRQALRHSHLRHHGAFLRPDARRRGRSIRELRARAAQEPDLAHRHLRYRGGGA